MDYTLFLLLCGLANAVTVQAQACSYPRGPPEVELSDEDILLETFPNGTEVTFVCKWGYTQSEGFGNIVCNAGNWSSLNLKCQKKNCGTLKNVLNGGVSYPNGTTLGSNAVVSCNTGFMLVGNSIIRCGNQGWMDKLPTCEVVVCYDPPKVAKGSFEPNKESYEYLDAVDYTCNRDLILNGSDSLLCSEDGTFKPEPPLCVKVACDEPNVDNSEWDGGARPPYGYQDSVYLKCLSGFEMSGSSPISCDINSKWSPKLPSCQRMTCDEPKVENSEWVGGAHSPYKPKDTVTLKCRSGFNMIGSSSITCDENGKWMPKLPSCQRKQITPVTTTEPETPPENGSDTGKIVGGVFGGALILALLIGFGIFFFGVPKGLKTKQGNRFPVSPL